MAKNIKIAFLGDISLNSSYINYKRQGLNPFKNIQPYLQSHDFVIGNLECMAKGEHGENELKKPRITTNVETLIYINIINLKIATLAHNHAYDHLGDGFSNTVNFLNVNSIRYLGAGYSAEQAAAPLIVDKNNIKIGLLNYVTADTNPSLPVNLSIHLNMFDLKKAENDIKALAKFVDFVIVLMHWGGKVEGGLFPDFDQPVFAKKMIDFGADIIIGHHSHTIQPFEKYNNKYIFYSLGNFCFSDFNFGNRSYVIPARSRITGILTIIIEKAQYDFSFSFFKNEGTCFTAFPEHEKFYKIQNIIYKILFFRRNIWKIYFYHKQYILPLILFLDRKDIKLTDKTKRLFTSLVRRLR